MIAERETARPWQGASGGYLKNVADQNSTVSIRDPQSADVCRILEAGIAEINAARTAAKLAVTDADCFYWRRTAEAVANFLADRVLKCRAPGPILLGRRVPPSLSFLRAELERQRKIAAKRVELAGREADLKAAWNARDTATWQTWERRACALSRAESELAELERDSA